MLLTTSFPAPRIALSDGMLGVLKCVALALMVLDHTDRFVLDGSMPAFFQAGRLAFPLFAVVLGWNLARPGLAESGGGWRVVKRLLLFGLIATLPYAGLLDYQWWQLNILFTLGAGATVVLLLHARRVAHMLAGLTVFAVSGALVDYAWYGVAVCVMSWAYFRQPRWITLLLWIASVASLYFINGNFTALLAMPLLWLASGKEIRFPRYRHFFYWFYPLHLAVLGLLAYV